LTTQPQRVLFNKCTTPDGVSIFVKHLISIKDDCYWFEGNPDSRFEKGIEYKSFDSRTYGCLKLNEFRMDGVAVPVVKNV
jgi:hypothetical protein